MGAPGAGMKAADQPAAESLLTAFKTLSAAERRRHASVLNYWLSVRGDKEFPPLHDLDPLELSDAGPNSVLMELISGGHDAEIRHLGEALRDEAWPERIIDAPNPSVLSCIAKKLPIVAISRDFLAFEDEYETAGNKTRVSVTLLPLSAGGAWVDYVYALVSTETPGAKSAKESARKVKEAGPSAEDAAQEPETLDEAKVPASEEPAEAIAEQDRAKADPEPQEEISAEPVEDRVEAVDLEPQTQPEAAAEPEIEAEPETEAEPTAEVEPEIEPEPKAVVEPETEAEPKAKVEPEIEPEIEPEPDTVPAAVAKAAPGFSKLLDSIAGLTGFYGSQPVKVEPVVDEEPEIEAVPETLDEAIADEPEAEAPVVEAPHAEVPAAEVPVAKMPAAPDPEKEGPAEEELDEAVAEAPSSGKARAEEPAAAEAPVAAKKAASSEPEGSLQNKLTSVRAKADEARMARLRANAALYEGLGAAYDFALDAEDAPEEYLRLVEAQGLKIQLRSPMKPVVKLAFAGMCDDATIKQLEAVLAWAFEEELPRGALAERIEAAGGIAPILNGQAKAA